MHYLNQEQISDIGSMLRKEKIDYSHLFEDLLDHVCCDIEIYMQKGLNYDQASQKTFNNIGLNGLREIQEATIFYVKFNLLIMKKLMNVLATIGLSCLVVSLTFKVAHWPGANMLFLFGFLALFFGFFPLALFSIKKESKAKFFSGKFLVYIVGFLSVITSGVAIIFTSMHWPGGLKLSALSWILTLFVFFPIVFYRISKSEKNRTINLSLSIFSFFFMAWLIISAYNASTDKRQILQVLQIENETEYYQQCILDLTAMHNGSNTAPVELVNSFLKLNNNLENYKLKYLNGADNIYNVVQNYLHRPGITGYHDNHFGTFRGELDNYKKISLGIVKNDDALENLINHTLGIGNQELKYIGNTHWGLRHLYNRRIKISFYINLCQIQKSIHLIHLELLRMLPAEKAPEL